MDPSLDPNSVPNPLVNPDSSNNGKTGWRCIPSQSCFKSEKVEAGQGSPELNQSANGVSESEKEKLNPLKACWNKARTTCSNLTPMTCCTTKEQVDPNVKGVIDVAGNSESYCTKCSDFAGSVFSKTVRYLSAPVNYVCGKVLTVEQLQNNSTAVSTCAIGTPVVLLSLGLFLAYYYLYASEQPDSANAEDPTIVATVPMPSELPSELPSETPLPQSVTVAPGPLPSDLNDSSITDGLPASAPVPSENLPGAAASDKIEELTFVIPDASSNAAVHVASLLASAMVALVAIAL